MAIIYSYPTVIPTTDDLVLGTDVTTTGKPTKNFTVQSLVDLIAGGVNGLGAVITANSSALDANGAPQSATGFRSISGDGNLNFLALNSTSIVNTAGITTLDLTATGTISGLNVYGTTFKTSAGSAASWSTTVLSGFTSVSTSALVISGAVSGASLIVATDLAGASNTNIASTLAIKTYVDNKVENQDTLAELLAKNPSPNANPSNTTGGTDILVSANDDITFTDTSKAIFGAASDLEIFHNPASGSNILKSNNLKSLDLLQSSIQVLNQDGSESMIGAINDGAVSLYYDGVKKFQTSSTGVTVTGTATSTEVFLGSKGTTTVPTYGFTGDVNTGMYCGATQGEIKLTSNGNTHYTFANAGATFTNGLSPATLFLQSDTFTTTTTTSSTKITRFVLDTDPNVPQTTPATFGLFVSALVNNTMVPTTKTVKTYVDTIAGAKVLKYQADAAATGTMPFSLNLSTDSLDIAGGTNMNTSTLAVTAGNLGVVTVNLDDNVTLPTATAAKGVFTGKKYADAVMNIEAGVGSAFKSITITPDAAQPPGAANASGFFGPLRASAASTNITAGVADKAVELVSQGTASVGNDIQVYPSFSLATNEVVAANAQSIVLASVPINNQTPIIGQKITGTNVVGDTLITGVTVGTPANKVTIAVDKQQTAGIAAGTTLAFATSAPIYTSGGPIVIPTFLPNTTATSKLLTGLVNGSATPILNTDSILGGMQNLQAQITDIPQGLVYKGTWNAATNDPTLADGVGVSGEFYIVNNAGNTDLDGITDWLVGDWAIFVEVGATDTWQKIDNTSEITGGGGAAGDIALFTSAQNIAPSVVNQTGSAGSFKVTLGSNSDFTVTGDTQLGDASTDTTLVKGPLSASKTIVLSEGFGVPLSDGATPPVFSTNYGAAGQVLTSGGSGGGSANIWTTPTVGEVVSITGLYGITVAGTAAVPTIAVTSDANNLIKLATAKATPVGADTILINDSAATNVLKQATLTSIKTFTAESWILSDGSNTTTISDGDTATFAAAGTGIAVAENNGTITITGSENPGTGTALTLPVWEAGGATLGDSMVSQDAAVGTKLTIASATPALIINDTTANKGDLKISRSLDATTYESSGITSGFGTYGTHVFSQTGGTLTNPPRTMLTLDASNNAKFEGDVRLITDDAKFLSTSSATGGAKYVRLYAGEGTGQWDIYSTGANLKIKNNLAGDNSSVLAVDTGATFGRSINVTGDGSFTGSLTTTDVYGTNSLRVAALGGILYLDSSVGTSTIMRTNGTTTALTLDNNQNAEFKGNVQIDGNLTVDGTISNGGGGIFNGDQAIVEAGFNNTFILTRATTGTLIFDVWFTSETGTAASVAKKYTVAHSYNKEPVYNKIIDTGPGTGNSDTNDFLVQFTNNNTGATGTSMLCIIKAVGVAQNISYTVQVGHDNANALTFTPNS